MFVYFQNSIDCQTFLGVRIIENMKHSFLPLSWREQVHIWLWARQCHGRPGLASKSDLLHWKEIVFCPYYIFEISARFPRRFIRSIYSCGKLEGSALCRGISTCFKFWSGSSAITLKGLCYSRFFNCGPILFTYWNDTIYLGAKMHAGKSLKT